MDASVRILKLNHPDGIMIINLKTGVETRFGIPEDIGFANIGGDSWMSSSTSHHDKKLI